VRRCATNPRRPPTPLLLLLAGLLTATQPTDAVGQERYAGPIDAGDHVEVRLHSGEVLAGRFIRYDRSSLVLEVRNRERLLAADDIDRVWRYDDRTHDFTVGGAVGGAAAMGVTGVLVTGLTCSTPPCGWSDAGTATLAWAAGGVLVGALAAWWRGRSRPTGGRSTSPSAREPRRSRCGWTSPSDQRPGRPERGSRWGSGSRRRLHGERGADAPQPGKAEPRAHPRCAWPTMNPPGRSLDRTPAARIVPASWTSPPSAPTPPASSTAST
jgi:hypothetical protein